ncbi:hypothetical protein As57867_006217, partial [Aphanomyces stellatus]
MDTNDSAPLVGTRNERQTPSKNSVILAAAITVITLIVAGQYFLAGFFAWNSPAYDPNFMDPRPNTANCSLHWFDQRLDHFTTLNTTYKQRYFVYDKFWARQANGHKKDGPIFFYCGNEGDVTLYVNNTGLMWENAEAFGALVIFAEHRYFGESMPFGDKYMDHLQYLTHEQALADYAFLLRSFQQDHNVQVPV